MSVQELLILGTDQMSSLYKVVFPSGIPGLNKDRELSLRLDQTFEIPLQSVNEWTFWHKGVKIMKPGKQEATDKKLNLNFRIDNNWEIYKGLQNNFEMQFNPKYATSLPTGSLRIFKIAVMALDAGTLMTKQIIMFEGCHCISIKPNDFDPNSGDPLRATATLLFNTMEFM